MEKSVLPVRTAETPQALLEANIVALEAKAAEEEHFFTHCGAPAGVPHSQTQAIQLRAITGALRELQEILCPGTEPVLVE